MKTLLNSTKFDTSYQRDLIFRLQKRAEIRRQINTRKSVQEGKPDRIADLLEEAAIAIRDFGLFPMTQEEFDNDKYA